MIDRMITICTFRPENPFQNMNAKIIIHPNQAALRAEMCKKM